MSDILPAITILLSSLFTTLWCCIRSLYQDSKLRILLIKLNTIFWALLWSEAVLVWAVRQWSVAGRVAGEWFRVCRLADWWSFRANYGWTRRHGLLLLTHRRLHYLRGIYIWIQYPNEYFKCRFWTNSAFLLKNHCPFWLTFYFYCKCTKYMHQYLKYRNSINNS